MRIIERIRAYYSVQQVEFGKVYRWCPEGVVVECDCGERLELTASETMCDGCGEDHAVAVREELGARRPGDRTLRPWRYDTGDHEDVGLPF